MFLNLFLERKFYLWFAAVVMVFFMGLMSDIFVPAGIFASGVLVMILVLDIRGLFAQKNPLSASREVGDKMSNGDQNPVVIRVANHYPSRIILRVIDEIPIQFQERDMSWSRTLDSSEEVTISYSLRPVRRGEYQFGRIRLFARSRVGLVSRRINIEAEHSVKVYPSYLRLRHYAFLAFDNRLQEFGVKRVRRLGHTMEFEQIKEYVPGDDTRALNWKATARTGKVMVNQYQDERAQPMYCIVDKGRLMQMPFDHMTLLDYAINATLVMSFVAINKNDKAGLITFAEKIDSVIKVGRRNNQMTRINEVLYNQETDFKEADFERLYAGTTRLISQRSLLLLMTNFESITGLKRQMGYLKRIAAKHVLVVIFFQNTELKSLVEEKAPNLRQVYRQTMAEKMQYEKSVMVKMLQQAGIHAVLTTPADLTIDTINKYLELKARGMF